MSDLPLAKQFDLKKSAPSDAIVNSGSAFGHLLQSREKTGHAVCFLV